MSKARPTASMRRCVHLNFRRSGTRFWGLWVGGAGRERPVWVDFPHGCTLTACWLHVGMRPNSRFYLRVTKYLMPRTWFVFSDVQRSAHAYKMELHDRRSSYAGFVAIQFTGMRCIENSGWAEEYRTRGNTRRAVPSETPRQWVFPSCGRSVGRLGGSTCV